MRLRFLLAALGALLLVLPASAQEDRPAKELFGAARGPAAMQPAPVGFYAKGCLAGAEGLPLDGPNWQAMRPSRNRNWGHPELVDYIEKLARDAAKEGWPGLLVGDMSQPRGGPMLTGHASHQNGLDVDIWVQPMPPRTLSMHERETMSARSLVKPGPHVMPEENWDPALGRMIRRAAQDRRVERIFVAPGIKRKLCETASGNRSWMSRVRPYYGHDDHIHVRLACPRGTPCKAQAAPPPGDGCGKELAYWYTEAPYKGPSTPAKPAPPMRLSALPPMCRDVLAAPGPGG
jgi:penicillin-insensitive murein endopeptidase